MISVATILRQASYAGFLCPLLIPTMRQDLFVFEGATAGLLSALWLIELFRGRVFWLPFPKAIVFPLFFVAAGYAVSIILPRESAASHIFSRHFSSLIILLCFISDQYRIGQTWLRWVWVPAGFIAIVVAMGLTFDFPEMALGIGMAMAPYWWLDIRSEESLMHLSYHAGSLRFEILAEGMRRLKALGIGIVTDGHLKSVHHNIDG